MGDWIDRTDGGLVTQSQAFSGAISSSPTTYGLVAADATALAADVTSYVNSYEAATDPATRTKVTVEQKSTAKDVLVARMRRFSDLPVAVGFGISKPEQVADVWRYADAAVVGSAIVSEIEQAESVADAVTRVGLFARQLVSG